MSQATDYRKGIIIVSVLCSCFFSLCGCSQAPTDTTPAVTESSEEPLDPSISPKAALSLYNPPALLYRNEMLDILQREEYGYLPPIPSSLSFNVLESNIKPDLCVGKAVVNKLQASGTLYERPFSFVFYETMPTDGNKHPFFIHNNFRDDIPDIYMPTEYLIDQGFAVLSMKYTDVTSDNNDFTDGLAGVIYPDGVRTSTGPGKIAMWAWAAQRVMDYAQTRSDVLDLTKGIICGHSRLGKTALLTAATDTRFAYAYSNDAGCSGDALSRAMHKDDGNETIEDIVTRFPHWFSENYSNYIGFESEMPFDQHYLIASIAPRRVLLGSAEEDIWANPIAQQLGALAASPAFNVGLVAPDRYAETGDAYLNGDIGFHKRAGEHYFKQADWEKLIRFINLHQ